MKVQSNPGKKKATLDGYCEVFVMSDEVSDSEETHKNLLEAQVGRGRMETEGNFKQIYELYVKCSRAREPTFPFFRFCCIQESKQGESIVGLWQWCYDFI